MSEEEPYEQLFYLLIEKKEDLAKLQKEIETLTKAYVWIRDKWIKDKQEEKDS